MVKKYSLLFHESAEPVCELVTKFGGQPVWVSSPQWPLSRHTGHPMKFIGQIRIYPEIFDVIDGKMAYIFLTYEFFDKYGGFIETWDPEDGESAVIIQPGEWNGPTMPLAIGPWTGRKNTRWFKSPPDIAPVEYTVELLSGEDPDEYPVPEDLLEHPEEHDKHIEALYESKIGGIPISDYLEEYPFPSQDEWQLLLQICEVNVPFDVNFGTDGIGTIFLSKDGKRAKLIWRRT